MPQQNTNGELKMTKKELKQIIREEIAAEGMQAQPKKFNVGDRVRLTSKFLHNTGQFAGGEGNRTWTVVPCDCSLCTKPSMAGKYVAVDEKMSAMGPDPEETMPRHRHINAANLIKVGSPDYSNL